MIQTTLFGEAVRTDTEIATNYLQETKGIGTPVIASLSGGKTSSYMALHYPADVYLFAVVLTEDPACQIKDKGLKRELVKKCAAFEEYGSRELDQTLINLLRLEQELGKEIKWIHGPTFDQLIRKHNSLPNRRVRFCTIEMKILPIFQYVTQNYPGEICEMQIGFRADEERRVFKMIGGVQVKGNGWNWDHLGACEKMPNSVKKVQWRFPQFPLYLDGIKHHQVKEFWAKKGWQFPDVSNCDYCFFHRQEEHLRQFAEHPDRAAWWIQQEERVGATFHKERTMLETLHGTASPLFEEDEPCHCTD